MRISIIVPVFNVEDYLTQCIESVLYQTYKNFELILINDGSTDSSKDICNRYEEKYPEIIRTFHIENGGAFKARLIGIKEAVGDVLVFLDSDDCIRRDALEKIVICFHEKKCDMVLYNAEKCKEFPTIEVKYPFKNGKTFEEKTKSELYKKIIYGVVPNSVCMKAIRSCCAYFPERFNSVTLKHGEDLLLSTCFITNCKKITYLDEGLYYYRNRLGSAVHSFDIQRKESLKLVHTELEKYIDEWKIPELKPVHNARKVKGWISSLKLLVINRKYMSKNDFKLELVAASKDAYFCKAYENIDKSRLSYSECILAWALCKKWYSFIILLCEGKRIMNKVKIRRNA